MHVDLSRTKIKVDHATMQRAIGLMQGAAVGDALGAPFEFKQRGTYGKRFPSPQIGGAGEMIGGGSFQWEPGEFTDDTQMALALAEAILQQHSYDADTVWAWFRSWAATAKDIGFTTSSALSRTDRHDVPEGSGSLANGALMRVFPIALAFLYAPDEVVEGVVRDQAALTHKHPAAGWGAWIAVEMMRRAVKGHDPLAAIPRLLTRLPLDARVRFEQMLSPDWSPDTDDTSNGSVWGCLAQAVWCLRTTHSFEGAVTAAVGLGADADTVACVTGALAGARYGVQAIPSRWVTYVHGSLQSPTGIRRYQASDLQKMALRLIGSADPEETTPESPAGPTEVAPGLYAADLLGAATVPTDWGVVSLCRTGDRFQQHPWRRQLFLIDNDASHNPGLALVVDDAVDAVQAFLAEGRNVVVHCHGGRSRTGLVLKAWKMRTDQLGERAAHDWIASRWHRYDNHNGSFVEHLRTLEGR